MPLNFAIIRSNGPSTNYVDTFSENLTPPPVDNFNFLAIKTPLNTP